MNSLDFYLAQLCGCKRDVARVAVKVGGLTDCVFTGLCGALPEAKGKGGEVQGAYSKANSGVGKVAIFLLVVAMFILTFTSCGTYQHFITHEFSKISYINELDGFYVNKSEPVRGTVHTSEAFRSEEDLERYGYLLRLFRIFDIADTVYITMLSTNEIKVTYCIDSIGHERIFKGKLKRKYFEVYHGKAQLIIPFIYSNIFVSRIRIGKFDDGNLLIRNFYEDSGNILIFAGGSGGWEQGFRFRKITPNHNNALQNCLCKETEHYTPPE